MEKRNGRKFGGDHTTYIDLAAEIVDIAIRFDEVTNVVPGVISASREGSTDGKRRVKFAEMRGGLLLKVRQSHTAQEVRIYTKDLSKTRLALAREARNRDVAISFQKPS